MTPAIAGLMTTAEAAVRRGCSRSTLEKERSQGKGPRYLRIGGLVRYRPEDIDDYLAGCVVETENSRNASTFG